MALCLPGYSDANFTGDHLPCETDSTQLLLRKVHKLMIGQHVHETEIFETKQLCCVRLAIIRASYRDLSN